VTRSAAQLRHDAVEIWQAGVAAVRSDQLVQQSVRVEGGWLELGRQRLDLEAIGRIVAVGAGKAGAGMARGLLAALGPQLVAQTRLAGWVNVPADCAGPCGPIRLHAARPAGVNEPTAAGVTGAEEILRLVSSLAENDLCIALISGGGSALLPCPVDGVTLDDKLAVTRLLSASGATIEDLNRVRKQLSRIKGGGLARACAAGRLVALIISDVLGDPLDLIASGPTVADNSTPDEAIAVLERFGARAAGISPRVFEALARRAGQSLASPRCAVTNVIIGNNRLAVEAAGAQARQLGYQTTVSVAERSEGPAESVGRELAAEALRLTREGGFHCRIAGGEPTVKLIDSAHRGRGGRNQQLVLAAAVALEAEDPKGVVILSGGTDGEDGPTDAAGAVLDATTLAAAQARGLDARDYLRRNDAYRWFEPLGGLIKTGPTHTNVCDVRVVVVAR
jgi:glycerate 2-kinase